MSADRIPTIRVRQFALDAPEIVAHLDETDRVMISASSRTRGQRRHLRLHRDAKGRPFIAAGCRGHDRRYLGGCEITYLDGEPTLYQFDLE